MGSLRGLQIAAILALLSALPMPGARAEAGFNAVVEKLRAGQALTPDEAALYSTELQRLIGKLANRQTLTPDEQAEIKALRQSADSPAQSAGEQ
jgi:hypothetical protein